LDEQQAVDEQAFEGACRERVLRQHRGSLELALEQRDRLQPPATPVSGEVHRRDELDRSRDRTAEHRLEFPLELIPVDHQTELLTVRVPPDGGRCARHEHRRAAGGGLHDVPAAAAGVGRTHQRDVDVAVRRLGGDDADVTAVAEMARGDVPELHRVEPHVETGIVAPQVEPVGEVDPAHGVVRLVERGRPGDGVPCEDLVTRVRHAERMP
jgi:hypothetical protein